MLFFEIYIFKNQDVRKNDKKELKYYEKNNLIFVINWLNYDWLWN